MLFGTLAASRSSSASASHIVGGAPDQRIGADIYPMEAAGLGGIMVRPQFLDHGCFLLSIDWNSEERRGRGSHHIWHFGPFISAFMKLGVFSLLHPVVLHLLSI